MPQIDYSLGYSIILCISIVFTLYFLFFLEYSNIKNTDNENKDILVSHNIFKCYFTVVFRSLY